ncbi:hypothetical protein [Chromobacterium haemolyticum]|uniref:hypothetical protein n=1 Tax=Chromobacterium haemolyticum TaxID=394935 RepID=UPI0011B2348F|nr:hypothetical protein [Chromobacterium haemolyticum]
MENWEAWYQSTDCDEYPANSAFSYQQEEAAFWSVGIMVQQKLQRELGVSYQVVTGFESRPVV